MEWSQDFLCFKFKSYLRRNRSFFIRHKTSWQKSNLENDINSCIDFFKKTNEDNFKFNYDFAQRYGNRECI